MLAHDPALYAHLDLSVQSRPHLTADQLELLLRRAGSFLSHIDLSYCKVVNGRHLALIFRDGISPSSLRFVSLAGCSHLTLDDRMDAIPGGARYIAELDVRDVLYVDDDMLQRVAEQCPYLRVLRVSRGFDISDEGVRAILDGCTRLECLELGNCPQVGVGAFNGNMVLSTLVHMDLAQCRSVDDVTVDRIVARCPNLRRLILDDCLGVTDEGMRALGQLAATLQVLGLARCNQLTDRGIAQLLLCDEDAAVATSVPMHARPLTSLDISGCPWITDRSLDLLPVGYPSLKELYVGECSGLSRRGLDRLREAYPNVLEITR